MIPAVTVQRLRLIVRAFFSRTMRTPLARGLVLAVRAEPIAEADRDAVWRLLEAQWPGYREYDRTAGRPVRMFRLVPR